MNSWDEPKLFILKNFRVWTWTSCSAWNYPNGDHLSLLTNWFLRSFKIFIKKFMNSKIFIKKIYEFITFFFETWLFCTGHATGQEKLTLATGHEWPATCLIFCWILRKIVPQTLFMEHFFKQNCNVTTKLENFSKHGFSDQWPWGWWPATWNLGHGHQFGHLLH